MLTNIRIDVNVKSAVMYSPIPARGLAGVQYSLFVDMSEHLLRHFHVVIHGLHVIVLFQGFNEA